MTNVASASTLDLLISYAARGWPVLPVWGIENGHCACPLGAACRKSQGKHPIGSLVHHGVNDASIFEEKIRAWYARAPNANWAIATGKPLAGGGYLVVLDIDPRNGGDEALGRLENEHGKLTETVTAISGGNGQHYFFRSREELGGAVLAEGIEVKASGGYVLVHPSMHQSGRRYEWDAAGHPDDTEIADLPAWVLESRTRVRPEHTGADAAETLLGEAFKTAGLLGELLTEGKRAVVCPWASAHTDGRGAGADSSAVLLPPTPTSRFGGFKCQHSHCTARGWRDVLEALPPGDVQQARAKYPMLAIVKPSAASEPPPAQEAPAAPPDTAHAWRNKLLWQKKPGKGGGVRLRTIVTNIVTILEHDPRWLGRITLDVFSDVVLAREPPWHPDDAPGTRASDDWTDSDDTRLMNWLLRFWDLEVTPTDCARAVDVVAKSHPVHPVRDWLNSLLWDGVPRVEKLFARYFGAVDDAYSSGISKRFLVSAVARVMLPGSKVDYCVVLEGAQGIGKSSGLRALTGGEDWFLDSAIDIGNPDGYRVLRGKWIVELAELDSYKRAEITRVKAFLTAQADYYRDAYARRHRSVPRQCIFAATTNERQYVTDSTGARRFWPIVCGVIDLVALRRDREQIWAETLALYTRGDAWHVDSPEFQALCSDEQDARYSADPWEPIVARWLAMPTRNLDAGITTSDVLMFPLGLEPGKVTRADEMRVSSVLRRLGYERARQMRDGKREYRFFEVRQVGQQVGQDISQ